MILAPKQVEDQFGPMSIIWQPDHNVTQATKTKQYGSWNKMASQTSGLQNQISGLFWHSVDLFYRCYNGRPAPTQGVLSFSKGCRHTRQTSKDICGSFLSFQSHRRQTGTPPLQAPTPSSDPNNERVFCLVIRFCWLTRLFCLFWGFFFCVQRVCFCSFLSSVSRHPPPCKVQWQLTMGQPRGKVEEQSRSRARHNHNRKRVSCIVLLLCWFAHLFCLFLCCCFCYTTLIQVKYAL